MRADMIGLLLGWRRAGQGHRPTYGGLEGFMATSVHSGQEINRERLIGLKAEE
jgi:hypothetical protein